MQKYLAAAAAMAIALGSTTSADAAQTIHFTGSFTSLLSGSAALGGPPVAVDLTMVLDTASNFGTQYNYIASSYTGTIGGVSFTGATAAWVLATNQPTGNAVIELDGTLSNGLRVSGLLSFFGPLSSVAVDQNYFDNAAISGNVLKVYNSSLTELGRYDGYSVGSFAVSGDAPTVPGPVPEPASWMMMIAGFGVAGAAMRRRVSRRVTFA